MFDFFKDSIKIDVLLGKTITKIEKKQEEYCHEIIFNCNDGNKYMMAHDQNCCEEVYIESIVGELDDLINSPITMARKETNKDNPLPRKDDSFTWTFYKLATVKGYVTIRWYGNSNGYYSEEVSFIKVNQEK
jgi:hypothetical protein